MLKKKASAKKIDKNKLERLSLIYWLFILLRTLLTFCPLGWRKQRTQDYDADSGKERVACTKLSVKVQEHGSSDINEVSKYMRSSLFLKKIKSRKIKTTL